MTIPKPSPRGGLGGKRKERSDSGPAAQALSVPQGLTQKGNTAQQYYPQLLDLFDLRPDPKKQTLKEVGVLVLPQLRGFGGFPEVEVQTSMRSREAWTELKKDGEMVPQVSPIELSPNREALESHDPSREHPNVERIPEVTPIAFNRTGNEWGPVTRSDRS